MARHYSPLHLFIQYLCLSDWIKFSHLIQILFVWGWLVFIENIKVSQTSWLFASTTAGMASHFVYVFFSLRFHTYLTFSLWLKKARSRKKMIISLAIVSPVNGLPVTLSSGWDGSPWQDPPHPSSPSLTQRALHVDSKPVMRPLFEFNTRSSILFLLSC